MQRLARRAPSMPSRLDQTPPNPRRNNEEMLKAPGLPTTGKRMQPFSAVAS